MSGGQRAAEVFLFKWEETRVPADSDCTSYAYNLNNKRIPYAVIKLFLSSKDKPNSILDHACMQLLKDCDISKIVRIWPRGMWTDEVDFIGWFNVLSTMEPGNEVYTMNKRAINEIILKHPSVFRSLMYSEEYAYYKPYSAALALILFFNTFNPNPLLGSRSTSDTGDRAAGFACKGSILV